MLKKRKFGKRKIESKNF